MLTCLVDLVVRCARVPINAAKENMATTPKRGNTQVVAFSFFWSFLSSLCWRNSWALYFLALGATGAHGFTGAGGGGATVVHGLAGGGGGAGATVAQGLNTQHNFFVQPLRLHTVAALPGRKPLGHVNDAQVGGGSVVVTVVGGVVVTVVGMTVVHGLIAQHSLSVQPPAAHTMDPLL